MKDDVCILYCKNCLELKPCDYAPSPDAGPYWRCSECGEIAADKMKQYKVVVLIEMEKTMHVDAENPKDAAERALSKSYMKPTEQGRVVSVHEKLMHDVTEEAGIR